MSLFDLLKGNDDLQATLNAARVAEEERKKREEEERKKREEEQAAFRERFMGDHGKAATIQALATLQTLASKEYDGVAKRDVPAIGMKKGDPKKNPLYGQTLFMPGDIYKLLLGTEVDGTAVTSDNLALGNTALSAEDDSNKGTFHAILFAWSKEPWLFGTKDGKWDKYRLDFAGLAKMQEEAEAAADVPPEAGEEEESKKGKKG